jgi:hypothetical protein
MTDQDPATALLSALQETRVIPDDAWTEGGMFDLALRLDRVNALAEILNKVKGYLETELADRMEADDVPIHGVGLLHRAPAWRSTWRTKDSGNQMREDLARAVATQVALDVATGDVDQMKRNVALHALRTAYEVIPSFSSLKVAGARRLGLDESDYRERSQYYTVKLEVGHEADR